MARAGLGCTVGMLFALGCSESTRVELSVRPVTLLADGRATAELFATVTGAGGAPVPGATVTFEAEGATITVDAGGVTDEMGKARASVRGTSAGVVTVRATAIGETAERDLELRALAERCPLDHLYGPATSEVGYAAVADLDGDGRLDLVGLGDPISNWIKIAIGNGDGTFGWPVELPHVTSTRLIAGDVDSDGVVDLVALGYQSDELWLRRGFGGASFADPVSIGIVPGALVRFALADVDGDMALDLAIRTSGALVVLYGNGDGSFGPAVTTPVDSYGLVTSDLDGDGRTDLIMGEASSRVVVVLGRADRALAPVTYELESNGIAVGELTDDAHLDLAVGASNGLTILPGIGSGAFGTPVATVTAGPISAVLASDLDGDGASDLITTSASRVELLRRTGPAAFAPPQVVSEYGLVRGAADFNGDGAVDILALGLVNHVSVILGDGTGGFQRVPRSDYVEVLAGIPLVVTDVDGDGAPDLVDRADESERAVRIIRQVPTGGFEAPVVYESGLQQVIAEDVDRDGDVDLIGLDAMDASPPSTRHVGVLLGQSGPGFAPGVRHEIVGPRGVALGLGAGDFDGDGRIDLIVWRVPDVAYEAEQLAFVRGNGDGTFGTPEPFPSSEKIASFVIGDFDHDARLDVAVAGVSTRLYRGQGNGTFAPPIELGPAGASHEILAGDLDGDGWPEAITISGGFDNGLTVIHGPSGDAQVYPRPFMEDTYVADIDRDGALDLVTMAASVFTVIPGDGAGGLDQRRAFHDLHPPSGVYSTMSIADVDLDGSLDIVRGGSIYHQPGCAP